MIAYIIRRLTIAIPILILISIVSFLLLEAMPGDASSMMIDPSLGAEARMLKRQALGLDLPIHLRYLGWFKEILQGNLGFSVVSGWPVAEIVGARIGPTITLMGLSMLLSIVIAIPLGIFSAIKQYSIFDNLITLAAFVGISSPTFFIGLSLIFIFSLKLDLLPTSMMMTPGEPFSIIDRLQHIILPTIVLAFSQVALYTRHIRSVMLEEMGQDYVRTARGKGLSKTKTLIKHVLRNGLIPLVTLIGVQIPNLFGGALITEQIFIWPGIGRLTVDAVNYRDYTILMAIIMISAILVVVSNLITDVLYAVLDPRIRYGKENA